VSRRFVFLDRDGTLVRDGGYTHALADYALLPGVRPGLRRLVDAGYRLAIITNQSGIARGYYDEPAFHAFQAHLAADLATTGIGFEASLFCPHLPDAGCRCRKPAPGLLWRARDELGADLVASWVIGDRASDALLAENAGCRGAVIVGAGSGDAAELPGGVARVRDLEDAAVRILAAG
jgi:D-glycero-D-manno-heptose 1,7-bisphosphate phosphatase